jgi:hypothetical protein
MTGGQGGALITLNILLYLTPSKSLMDRALIQSTLVLKILLLVYLAESTLLNLSLKESLDLSLCQFIEEKE